MSRIFSRIALQVLGALCLMPVLASAGLFAQELPVVAVFNGQDASPYQQTRESFMASLMAAREVEVVTFDDETDMQRLRDRKPDLVFALGGSAVKQSLETLGDQPLLATMLLSESAIRDSHQATAVVLQASVTTQLEWHRRLLPNARRGPGARPP